MADRRPKTESEDPRVSAALAEYLHLMDRGESVPVAEFLARHPDIADDLRSLLVTSEELAQLKPDRPAPQTSTRSMAEQNVETIAPQRVQAASASETVLQRLPDTFGRYRIIRPLGSGAMGDVYLAEDTQLHRQVAIKTPSFDADETGELLERFYREARSAAVVRHSNICPVFDVGEINGRHYISMAYIEGQPLSAYIRPDKLQPERQALVVIRKLALALQEAHDHGIIHRDLKPGNVMIDRKGEPIVMDFGLARPVQSDAGARLTQSGMLVGSPAYMSPEQVEGETSVLMPATDQYSLGVILYELLTGGLPFRGGITAIIASILTKSPKPPGELRAGLDPRIESLCLKMMAKSPRDRFPSMRAVADAIAAILKSDAVRPDEKPNAASTPQVAAPRPEPKPQRAQPAAPVAASVAAASITASNVETLFDAAAKCMRKHDYEQVVQMLDGIPEHKRNDQVRALLKQARELSDEVAFLLAEIDEAMRLNDNEALEKHADALLKLKPRHHKAMQIKEELSRYGGGRTWKAGGWTPDGRRIGEGSWIPWLPLSIFAGVFGLSLLAVTLYLRVGDAIVRVQISHPDVEVGIKDRTLNIKSANQDIKVDPGEDTLTVSFQGAEFQTDKFTLNKGENPAIVVELLDKTLSARFGDLSIGEWPVEVKEAAQTAETLAAETPTPTAVTPSLVPSTITETPNASAAEGRWIWSDPVHIGPSIDTQQSAEPTATVSADELTIIFGRSEPGANMGLWTASRPTRDAPFGPAAHLANVNSDSPEGSPALSADGRTLYFDAFKRPGGGGAWDLWYAQRTADLQDFGAPRSLGAPINSAASEAGPKVTTDNLLLFFHSDRPGSPGQFSIWMSSRSSAQQPFGEPVPLGPNVNTAGRNMDPAISADGNVLIFTSDRPSGLGGSDLWMTTRTSRSAAFGPAVNLGPKINRTGNEGKPALSPDNKTLYFFSNRGGEGELWYARRADSTATANSTGWTDLFNGRDLTGWSIHRSNSEQPATPWAADSDRQVIIARAGGHSWLETEQTYSDFTLSLEWRFPPGASVAVNGSGIVVRADGLNAINYDPKGIEIDVLNTVQPGNQRGTGGLVTYDTPVRHREGASPNRGNGMIGPMAVTEVYGDGGWNRCEITCQGDRLTVEMNGVVVNEATSVPQRAGRICLRNQNTDIEFRNVRIRATEGSDAEERSTTVATLQGSWKAIAQEISGGVWTSEQIKEHEKSLSFAGDRFEIRYRDGTRRFQVERGTYQLNPAPGPAHITMTGTTRDGRAIEFVGIIQMDGNELRHCFVKTSDNPAAARPTSFSTSKGQFSTTYRREGADAAAAANGADRDWTILFNGSDLTGWVRHATGEPVTSGWTVEDGALHLRPPGGGDIRSAAIYADFELEFEWKVARGANSGVIYRARTGDPQTWSSGPEYQVLDDANHVNGQKLLSSAGSIYNIAAQQNRPLNPVGQWNQARIFARGSHLEHWLNGSKVAEVEIGSAEWNQAVAQTAFAKFPQFGKSGSGHIVLQDHGDEVWFRNIRIRELSAAAAAVPDGLYQVLFNKDQGWRYTYRVEGNRFTRETVDIIGSGNGPQPLTEGRGTLEQLEGGKVRLVYEPGTWNGSPPTEVWTPKGDGTYSSEYWHPADNYVARKPPNLTGVVTAGTGDLASRVTSTLPRNQWINLDPSAETCTSWNYGEPLKNPQNKLWTNDTLVLDSAAVAYNHIQARDVSIKARVKMIEGQNIALVVRSQHGKGGIYAYIDRVDKERVRVAFLNTKHERTLKVEDEFEYEVTAVGNRATIKIDDKTVLEDPNVKIMRSGHVETTAYKARGTFKKIQVKILDQ